MFAGCTALDRAISSMDSRNSASPPAQTTIPKAPATAKPPVVSMREAMSDELGSSNRDQGSRPSQWSTNGRQIVVTWPINDNLTDGMIKDGARLDTFKILKTIRNHPDWQKRKYVDVVVRGTYSMQNTYGEVREAEVIEAFFSRATINRIQFDNILFKGIFDLADPLSVTIHPEFQ
jgi:hypothetical protein